jgi:phage terminase small subunit
MAGREGLRDREKAFCRYVVAGSSNTQAAIKAGYSANGASVQATRLMKKETIRGEIERLRQAASDAVSSMLVPAMRDARTRRGDDSGPELPADLAAISKETAAEVVAMVDRNWTLAKLLKNFRVALGEMPIPVTRQRKRKDGGVRNITEQILKPDAAAANRAAELLLKHLPATVPKIGGDADVVDPQVLAVMRGFSSVVTGLREREKAKRAATDIDQSGEPAP